jgi:EAL domain-containing protein (putative c-di-GMP-specific phosphodiesterase class I)
MINDVLLSMEGLILHTGQLDLQLIITTQDQFDTLKRLGVDFGQGA